MLASPFGFLVGLALGALGGGGSILAVPILVFVAGQRPSAATTTSLIVVFAAAVFGATRHHAHGRVRLKAGLAFGAVGIAGSIAGSAVNRRLDGDFLLLGFSLLILVAAWRMVAARPAGTPPEEQATRVGHAGGVGRAGTLVAAGTGVGFMTGLFGVGGGFVIVPTLALVLAFPMAEAVGTSLVVIAVNSAVALAARFGGSIDWTTTLLFAGTAIPGVAVGTRLANRLDGKAMQRAFAALLVGVALYTGGRAVAGIW